jgi:predicted enzyme related to lactoylglutathione lyase
MARLFRVILPVTEINRAAAFYAVLLGIEGRRVSAGRHYFDCGGTILACYEPWADGDDFDLPPNPDHLYFAVDDLEATFARATALDGCRIDEGIQMQPWGERCFYIRDPFGNRLCFVDERTVFRG